MILTNDQGWFVGDAQRCVEKTTEGTLIPLYVCNTPENYVTPQGSFHVNSDQLLLKPAYETIGHVFPSPGYERSKILRAAVAIWVRAKNTGNQWQADESKYDTIRPGLEKLFAHKLWERFDVVGSIVNIAIPKRQIAATADLVVRFRDNGNLGLISIWNGPDSRIHPNAAWADLGSSAEGMELNGLPIEKAIVIWVNNLSIKIEAKSGADDGVNECQVLWFDACHTANKIRSAQNYIELQKTKS